MTTSSFSAHEARGSTRSANASMAGVMKQSVAMHHSRFLQPSYQPVGWAQHVGVSSAVDCIQPMRMRYGSPFVTASNIMSACALWMLST